MALLNPGGFSDMTISLTGTEIVAFAAFVVLIGPTLIGIGIVLKSLWGHEKRLDLIENELGSLSTNIVTAINEAWRNCPLAKENHKGAK